MTHQPNIFSTIVFDLHPRVKSFIDDLTADGQIDLDNDGYPYLVAVERRASNFIVHIVRNNKIENFIINPRKKADPLTSWDCTDGFVRPDQNRTLLIQPEPDTKKERERRVPKESIKRLVDQILTS